MPTSSIGRTALALVAAVTTLVVMAWFDTSLVNDAAQRGVQTFDRRQYVLLASLGTLMTAGAVLGLGLLAWRSRSAVVGVFYAASGGYLAFQTWIWMDLASGQGNGGQPVLPYPFDRVVNHTISATVGPLNAVGIIGGGMLIAGIAVIARWLRERSGASEPR
jgi:hypothetical protein